jgi:adenylate cyclase
MTLVRITFLLLVFMSLNVYAQNQPQASLQISKQQAYKFDEYGKITIKQLRTKLINFLDELVTKDRTGYIVIYAPNQEKSNLRVDAIIRAGIKQIVYHKYDRIRFIGARSERERTEFWVLPQGSESAEFISEVYKYGFFYETDQKECNAFLHKLAGRLRQERKTSYLVYFGKNYKKWESDFRKDCSDFSKILESSQIFMVNGGFSRQEEVEIWITPIGAKPPIEKREK